MALVFCTSNGTPLASNNLRKRQLAFGACARRTCADQLADAEAYARNTPTRARNASAGGTSSAWAFAHHDHARSVHARQHERAKGGR